MPGPGRRPAHQTHGATVKPAHRMLPHWCRRGADCEANAFGRPPGLRKDGRARVTGAACYVDDMRIRGLLHGRTIRSEIACGELLGTRLEGDRRGFTVVDHRDIPGRNVIALIADDQRARGPRDPARGEPSCCSRMKTGETLFGATVRLDCRPGKPVLDPLASTCRSRTF